MLLLFFGFNRSGLDNRCWISHVPVLAPARAICGALAQGFDQEEDTKTQRDQEGQANDAEADQEIHQALKTAHQFLERLTHHARGFHPPISIGCKEASATSVIAIEERLADSFK